MREELLKGSQKDSEEHSDQEIEQENNESEKSEKESIIEDQNSPQKQTISNQ